jgi:hypothetical protein
METHETPAMPIKGLRLQAAVVCAAERLYRRQQQVHAAVAADPAMAGTPLNPPPTFNEFMDQMLVRGLVQIAPVLLELERSVGLVETTAPQDLDLLRRVVAKELEQLASGLAAVGAAQADRALSRASIGAIADAAATVRAAAIETAQLTLLHNYPGELK